MKHPPPKLVKHHLLFPAVGAGRTTGSCEERQRPQSPSRIFVASTTKITGFIKESRRATKPAKK